MSTADETRRTAPPPDSSPRVHEAPANGNRFNVFEDSKAERENMLRELGGRVVFGMPVKEFLKLIPHAGDVPSGAVTGNAFRDIVQGIKVVDGTVKKMEPRLYTSLAEIIGKLLGPEFMVKVTANKPDKHATPDKQWSPALIAYLKEHGRNLARNPTDFSWAELLHEVKLTDFACDVDAERLTPEQREAHVPIKSCIEGEDILSQICLCLAEQNNRQHRTHSFHVFYSNNVARLIRQDHAGVIVSKAIEFRKDSKDLEEFYYRFKHATPESRGHDPSVRRAVPRDAGLARCKLPQPQHGLYRPVFVIDLSRQVEDSSADVSPEVNASPRPVRAVFVWGPRSELRCLTGKTTKAFVAIDVNTHELLFLQDTWRADIPGIEKENDIIQALNADVLSGEYVVGAHQRTITQDYIDAPWRIGRIGNITPRAHYRIFENMIPESIDDLRTLKEMRECVGRALTAHRTAYEGCKFLHGDVLADDVMISSSKITEKREGGVRCDCDLAVHMNKDSEGEPIPCNCSRQSHCKVEDFVQDDMQSFFW